MVYFNFWYPYLINKSLESRFVWYIFFIDILLFELTPPNFLQGQKYQKKEIKNVFPKTNDQIE